MPCCALCSVQLRPLRRQLFLQRQLVSFECLLYVLAATVRPLRGKCPLTGGKPTVGYQYDVVSAARPFRKGDAFPRLLDITFQMW